jgi:hypothetical protein
MNEKMKYLSASGGAASGTVSFQDSLAITVETVTDEFLMFRGVHPRRK